MARILLRTNSAAQSLDTWLTMMSLKARNGPNNVPSSQLSWKRRLRSSSVTCMAPSVGRGNGTPIWDRLAVSRYSPRSAATAASISGGVGPLPAGTEKLGVRWKTVSAAACAAMIGIAWIPEEPVPITPTRMPVKSTPSWGQRLVK